MRAHGWIQRCIARELHRMGPTIIRGQVPGKRLPGGRGEYKRRHPSNNIQKRAKGVQNNSQVKRIAAGAYTCGPASPFAGALTASAAHASPAGFHAMGTDASVQTSRHGIACRSEGTAIRPRGASSAGRKWGRNLALLIPTPVECGERGVHNMRKYGEASGHGSPPHSRGQRRVRLGTVTGGRSPARWGGSKGPIRGMSGGRAHGAGGPCPR